LGFFFPSKSHVLILTKDGLGYISGDFFANPSGHPGSYQSKKDEVLVHHWQPATRWSARTGRVTG
jgi:hypothetical protein